MRSPAFSLYGKTKSVYRQYCYGVGHMPNDESHSLFSPSWGEEAEADLVVGQGRAGVAKGVEQAL